MSSLSYLGLRFPGRARTTNTRTYGADNLSSRILNDDPTADEDSI
jgi:hypothetical protein